MAVEIYSSGTLVSSGTPIVDAVLATDSNNSMFINNGGTASNTVISSGGLVDVKDGGLAVSTTVSSGGNINIGGASLIDDLMIKKDGMLNGFSLQNQIFYSNTVKNIHAANVHSGVAATLYGGQVLSKAFILNGGTIEIHNDAYANEIYVSAGGTLDVKAGGSATNVIASSGATLNITLDKETHVSGLYFKDNEYSTIYAMNGVVNGFQTENGGYITVVNGGIANSTTILDGTLVADDRGLAKYTMISGGGLLHAIAGGSAMDTFVYSGGNFSATNAKVTNLSVLFEGQAVINSGTIVENLHVSGGDVYITNGGSAFGEVAVRSNGVIYVTNKGVLDDALVNFGGHLHISQGGSANNTDVSEGTFIIANGGIAFDTITNDCGTMTVKAGGSAHNISVKAGGSLTVESGASVTGIQMAAGASITIKNGAIVLMEFNPWLKGQPGIDGYDNISFLPASNYVYIGSEQDGLISSAVEYNDMVINGQNGNVMSALIYSGASMSNTEVGENGYLEVLSGGVALQTVVSSGGSMLMQKGGIVTHAVISSGAFINGFEVTGNSIKDGLMVPPDKTLEYIVVDTNDQYIAPDKTLNNFFIISGGLAVRANDVVLYGNQAASTVEILENGKVSVSSGGILKEVLVNDNGGIHVFTDGVVSSAIVKKNGSLNVSEGGFASQVWIRSGGTVNVLEGGKVDTVEANDQAKVNVSSYGKLSNVNINTGATMTVYENGYVENLDNYNSVTLNAGASASGVRVRQGAALIALDNVVVEDITIDFGGTLNGFVGRGTKLEIEKGVVLNNVMVATSATLYAGQSADDVIMTGNGMLDVKTGATLKNVTVNNTNAGKGVINVFSGASLDTVEFLSYGQLNVLNDAKAVNIQIGGTAELRYTMGKESVKCPHNVTVNDVEVPVELNIDHAAADMHVEKSYASNVTLLNGGTLHVSNGGLVEDITVQSDGRIVVSAGALVRGGTMGGKTSAYTQTVVVPYEYERKYTVTENGNLVEKTEKVEKDYNYTKVFPAIHSASMEIQSGGSATNFEINAYASAVIQSKAYLLDTTINNGGSAIVSSGGSGYNLIVNNGGTVVVKNEGTAQNLILNNGAGVTVESNGQIKLGYNPWGRNYTITSANGAVVDDSMFDDISLAYGAYLGNAAAGVIEYSAEKFDDKIIRAGQSALILNGGTARNTVVSYGGQLYVTSSGYAQMAAGYAESATVLNGGVAHVTDGASAEAITVCHKGEMRVSKGGIASNTVISSGGSLCLSSGSIHKGTMTIVRKGSTIVSAHENARIDFTISERSTGDDYLLNNFSWITGTPNYSITVSADQRAGTYKLAQQVNDISQIGEVGIYTDDGIRFGNLEINGKAFTVNGMTYDLNNDDDGNLTLDVAGTPVMAESAYAIGNSNGTTYKLSTTGIATVYSVSGKNQVEGAIDPGKWELLAADELEQSGSESLLWKERETGNVYAQNDLTNFDELINKSNYIGSVGKNQEIISAGDFAGKGSGFVTQSPVSGAAGIFDLSVWNQDNDGANGKLGTLVNTWQPGESLKGNTEDQAEVNANNYMHKVVAAGDFNGDGVDDLLMQNTMPETVDGVKVTGAGDVFAFLTDSDANDAQPTVSYVGNLSGKWEIIGSGDFNGDNVDDILLTDGTNVIGWQMADGKCVKEMTFGELTANDTITGITDLNNDGTDDILILNSDTQALNGWLIKNGSVNNMIAIA